MNGPTAQRQAREADPMSTPNKNIEKVEVRLKWDPKEQEQGLTNCMTFISGPSKTADIELVMVQGAHGPKKLVVYVITNS